MEKLLYNIGVFVYHIGIQIAAYFNLKAKHWVQGRRGWRLRYARDWQRINGEHQPCVWMHCASLGEFEQGRPVLEQLKKEYPTIRILLTFFSPSGYEIRKNYAAADYVCYLPLDTHANALAFIEIFQPALSIFVKYEFWHHYLTVLHQKPIPTLLISAVFRQNQVFFKWYGGLFRKLLFTFKHIFTQNQTSAHLLQSVGLQNFTIVGDTRIDRVLQMAKDAPTVSIIESFVTDYKVLIIGSSWQPDEALLLPFMNDYLPKDWKVIIAPHDIQESHIQQIERGLHTSNIRYSKADIATTNTVKVLLIDNIGMLSALYQYGNLAYIGGGFGAGIHNTLEPIAFGLPVIFGPKFQKFEEAVQLTKQGGAFVIQDLTAFQAIFDFLQKEENYQKASTLAKQYVMDNQGATQRIMSFIRNFNIL